MAILYRIALTQARSSPEAQAYLARRKAEGKTWRESIRALKRYLIRAMWQLWQQCLRDKEQAQRQQTATATEERYCKTSATEWSPGVPAFRLGNGTIAQESI